MNISTDSFEFDIKVDLDAMKAEATGCVVLAEENENKCAALVAYIAVDARLLVFTRDELLQKMYKVLALAASVDVDGVAEIENDIDDVRGGAALADFVEYFEF